jgi:hypothetical protein
MLQRSAHEPRLQLAERDLIVPVRRKQVAIRIERHLNCRMPHQHLYPLRSESLFDEKTCGGMSQSVHPVLRVELVGRDSGRNLQGPESAAVDAG